MKFDIIKKLNKMNSNKYLAGITLLMLNLGSKYLIIDISKSTEQLLKLSIIRRFTIFSIFFIATRNIAISLGLTAVFIIFSSGLFNEKSKFCILPKKIKEAKIEKKEYSKALEIVKEYNKDKNNKIEDSKQKEIINLNYNNMKNKFNY
tara:strand:- start:1121 stop:1564 length:444 start_codon:yes stop_codon:yes gene_type:complete